MFRSDQRRCCIAVLAAAGLFAVSPAQDDLRDVVTLKVGEPLRGRVFARYEPDHVTVQVGKRRQQIPRTDVLAMDTVRDRVREFFARVDRLPDNLRHRWYLAQWAVDRELPDLARLAALEVVLRDPDHADAHRMLGHRQVRGEWRWPVDGEWQPFAEVERIRADWQDAWQLDSEHFRVRSNADLRRVMDALWDLERFHLAWFDRFGDAMRLYEVVESKLAVEIWRDVRRFPAVNSLRNPDFRHGGGRDGEPAVSRTYFAEAGAARPLRLFEVVTAHLIHHTVGDCPNYSSFYRPAAWAEVGLGRYLQRSMTGPAGAAVPGPWRIDAADGALVLRHPERDLDHVTQWDTKKYYYQVSDDLQFECAAAEQAVAFLLEAGQPPGLRSGFGAYLQEVLRPVKGSSSRDLDRCLGQPIQELDRPWREWIRQQLQPGTQPTSPPTRSR